jgi:hypothetical protein
LQQEVPETLGSIPRLETVRGIFGEVSFGSISLGLGCFRSFEGVGKAENLIGAGDLFGDRPLREYWKTLGQVLSIFCLG